MTARELEALMVIGPDFREKAITGPLGSFPLADAFAECGLTDPCSSSAGGYGLAQWFSPRMTSAMVWRQQQERK